MKYIDVDFSNPADYHFESGIEIVEGMIRLIDPRESTPYAFYFLLDIPGTFTHLEIYSTIRMNSEDTVPIYVSLHEPSFEEIHNQATTYTLNDLWSVLQDLGSSRVYIGIILQGRDDYIEYPIVDGIGFWDFDRQDAVDWTGNGHDGIVSGITWVPGVFNTWGMDPGASGYVTIPDHIDLQITGDMTLMFHIKPDSLSVRRNVVYQSEKHVCSVTLETSGLLNYYWGDGIAARTAFSTVTPLQIGTTYHIALVRSIGSEPRTITWYIDGSPDAQLTTFYSSCASNNNPWKFGNGNIAVLDGMLDEIGIYDTALDSSEISAMVGGGNKGLDWYPPQITNLRFHYSDNTHYAGNVIKEKVYSFIGQSGKDNLIELDNLTEQNSDCSNLLFTRDRQLLPHILIDEGVGRLKLLFNSILDLDNILVHVNNSGDSHRDCQGLIGNGVDFTICKGIKGHGPMTIDQDRWKWDFLGNSFYTETNWDQYSVLTVLRKSSIQPGDFVNFRLVIGDLSFLFPFTDDYDYIPFERTQVPKPNHPWTNTYRSIRVDIGPKYTHLYIDGIKIGSTRLPNGNQIRLVKNSSNCTGHVKSFYVGPLLNSESEFNDIDNLEPRIIHAGQFHCMGPLYHAGSRKLDALDHVFMLSHYLYIGEELLGDGPGLTLPDPVLFGFKDHVTLETIIYYGSKTTDECYVYRDGDWSLEGNFKTFGGWKSKVTEGLIIQRPGTHALMVYMLGRDPLTNKLQYEQEWSLSGLPESGDFKLDTSMDRRISGKVTPWVWVKDLSLTS